LESVKPAFFSIALNEVSSCSIIGAGSAGAIGTAGESGVVAAIGRGGCGAAFDSVVSFIPGPVDDARDQPTSESVVGFDVIGVDEIETFFGWAFIL
jgi:hypothetical protein